MALWIACGVCFWEYSYLSSALRLEKIVFVISIPLGTMLEMYLEISIQIFAKSL
jgi:hypothetical protein